MEKRTGGKDVTKRDSSQQGRPALTQTLSLRRQVTGKKEKKARRHTKKVRRENNSGEKKEKNLPAYGDTAQQKYYLKRRRNPWQ